MRKWIKISSWLFLFGAAVGVVTYFIRPQLLLEILNSFQDRFGENPALDFNLAKAIFLQNSLVAILAIAGGLILGLFTGLILLVNGFILGFVTTASFALGGISSWDPWLLVLGGILPHGILELPAIIFAASLGLRLGIEWLWKSSEGNRGIIFKSNLIRALKYIPLIILVLFIAAIIEVFVSGKIVGN